MDFMYSDKRFEVSKLLIRHKIIVVIFSTVICSAAAFGFDSANSCSSSPNAKMSRRGRGQLLATIPCDLTHQAYCNVPGSAYPWQAVRRFLHDNQGLVRRMYGDQRHISVLRDEMESNEVDGNRIELVAERYTRRSKSMHNHEPDEYHTVGTSSGGMALNDVLTEPHFRQVFTTVAPTTTSAAAATISNSIRTRSGPNRTQNEKTTRGSLNHRLGASTTTMTVPLKPVLNTSKAPPRSVESDTISTLNRQALETKSAYENHTATTSTVHTLSTTTLTPANGENIHIIDSPKLDSATANLSATTLNAVISITHHQTVQPQVLHRMNNTTTTMAIPMTTKPATTTVASMTTKRTNVFNKAKVDPPAGEKFNRPGPAGTATLPPSVVLRDGQLFQDSLKQDSPPVLNMRGINACPVKEEVVAPFWANNTRGEVLALLNLYPFEQYVHWEQCTHEHKQMYCRDGCRCEQQFRLHRLLAYDPHNECRGIFSDWFRFPSCCICKCYNVPPIDFRTTSRSPRSQGGTNLPTDENYQYDENAEHSEFTTDRRAQTDAHPLDLAEAAVKRAIYEHAAEDWYRPKDELYFYDG